MRRNRLFSLFYRRPYKPDQRQGETKGGIRQNKWLDEKSITSNRVIRAKQNQIRAQKDLTEREAGANDHVCNRFFGDRVAVRCRVEEAT